MASGRSQPEGARLDEAGQRLWRWEGTGALEEFYSVTTMINGGIPKHLERWYAKLAAECAYDDVLDIPSARAASIARRWENAGRDYLAAQRADGMKLDRADETPRGLALRWLKSAPDRARDAARDIGSDVHDAAEAYVLQHAREGARLYAATGDLPHWSPEVAARMGSFAQFLDVARPIYLLTEANVFNRRRSYAGRADAFMRIRPADDWTPPPWVTRPFVWEQEGGPPGWLTTCTDYKAGRAVYHEVAVQTAAYAHGEFVGAPDRMTELPLPRVDSGAVLHLGPKHFRFKLVGPLDQAFRTFLYAREVFAWVHAQSRAATRTWDGGEVPFDLADGLAASLDAIGAA